MNDPFSIREANAADVPLIGQLAWRIWPETYAPILDPAQVEYMMQLFYSAESLAGQMENGHRFLIASWYNLPSGFADYSIADPDPLLNDRGIAATERWKLNKIYLDPLLQGKGLGKKLLQAVCDIISAHGGKRLQLNVNRFNPARRFYEKQGFMTVREEDNDIGQGFFMNDYIMEKQLGVQDEG